MKSLGKKSAANICYYLVNITWYLSLALAAGFILMAVFSPADLSISLPVDSSVLQISSSVSSAELHIDNASVEMSLAESADHYFQLLIYTIIFATVLASFWLTGIFQLKMILKDTVKERIFTSKNIRRIKIIALIVFISEPVKWLYFYLIQPLATFIQGERGSFSIGFGGFDLNFVILGLLIYALATVFEKGYEMYRELKLTV